jgi:A/G-specific adenine glycosylase
MNFADSEEVSTDGATAPEVKKVPRAAKPGKPARAGAPSRRRASAAASAVELNGAAAGQDDAAVELTPIEFRRRLGAWYRTHARELPWRSTTDPYYIWVSEIMLQQTRVAAVIAHFNEFIRRFPTLVSLALAPEADVLAAWSGLGYYRRARMLHRAAQFIVTERDGRLPARSAELRTLPGIGEYTAAAIASIAFGEAVAVVDGNVERVILRLTGRANEATAASQAFVRAQAQALMPHAALLSSQLDSQFVSERPSRPRGDSVWDATERIAIAASAHPTERSGGDGPGQHAVPSAAGDHNQAMMELGATVCLPRAPLCLQCPVYALCLTRGEHPTPRRAPQRSQPAAFLLDLRKRGPVTEVLLELRAEDAARMPAMYELPALPLEAVEGREPVLRVRHAITNTNYYVQVFAARHQELNGGSHARFEAYALRRAVPAAAKDLHWVRSSRLASLPLTGLARKVLQRLHVMDSPKISLLE